MKLFSDTAQSHPAGIRTGCARRLATLCLGLLVGGLPYTYREAVALPAAGGIPPSPPQKVPDRAVRVASPPPAQALAPKPAPKPAKAAPPLVGNSTKAVTAAAAAVAAKVAPAAKSAAAQPAPISGAKSILGGGGLNGQIPRTPSVAITRAPDQPAKPAEAASSAPRAAAAPPPPAPASTKAQGGADRPAATTAAAAAQTAAGASRTSTGGGLGNPVKTEYVKGSDGHEITINYYRNPDGTLLKTAVSPAAFPPPNASAAQAAPASAPQAAPSRPQRAERSGGAAPGNAASNSAPAPATWESAGSGSVRNSVASEPGKLAYAPSSSAIDPSTGKAVGGRETPRGQVPHGPTSQQGSPVAASVPQNPASQQRNPDPGSITVMLPDSSADPGRAGAPAAQPPRQGMDMVDRSIGEFDATRPTAAAAPKNAAGDSPAWRASGQTRAAKAAAPRTVAQAGDDEYAADPPRNRRPRQARPATTRAVAAAPGNPVQPLIFGRVTRASFALARLQSDTVTRGLRVAENPVPASAPRRPGELSGRGIAQTADLGRSSPAYGAAPDVFARASDAATTTPVACKARAPARHVAARRAGQARVTACS